MPISIKPRPHQQQCRSNIVECHKSNDSFDKVEYCFDIVAVVGNKVECCFDKVERCFDMLLVWTELKWIITDVIASCDSYNYVILAYFSVFEGDCRLQKLKEMKRDFREKVYKSPSSFSCLYYVCTCICLPDFHFFLPDCLPGLLPRPFLLSYSVFVFIVPYFFVSGPCARLSWLLSAR